MFVLLFMTSLSTLTFALCQSLSLGRARHFCMNRISPLFAHAILWLLGVRLQQNHHQRFDATPTVYILNHTSTLDPFIMSALGIPNLRSIMSQRIRALLPLAWMGDLLGHFFIPGQDDPQGRAACYQHVEATLWTSQDTICITPEGTRMIDGSIGPFNKGAFHLAMNLGWPIVPLFVDIPQAQNPGKGFAAFPCTVRVHRHTAIDTSAWSLETLNAHKSSVRTCYLSFPKGGWQHVSPDPSPHTTER